MSVVLVDSVALRHAIAELPNREEDAITIAPHPAITSPRMALVGSATYRGETTLRELAERFGECRWSGGRWRRVRAQLSLF